MSQDAYRKYVLAALTAVYTLNLVDRGLIMLLLQPIKEDLDLSDTQLGFITGIAFGLFYATLGLPIARWADRGNRVTITSLAIGLWGLTVMSCMLVTNYTHLVCARIAAAIGESGCKPPTYSLVGDYFPGPAERTRAMSIYWLGSPLSSLIAFIVGGWLSGRYGWRLTFFIMGIPGLLLAMLIKWTVVEPRVQAIAAGEQQRTPPAMKLVFAVLWRQRSSRYLSLALILLFMMGFGLGPWYAAFLMRTHGMTTGELGVWLGVIFGLAGVTGTLLGGYLAARWFANNERGQLRMTAVAVASLAPFFLAFLTLPNRRHAMIALMPLMVAFNFFFAPTYTLMQRLVADEMRATTLAIVMLLANVIGMGIGPQAVGVLSDLLMPAFGRDSLRYAMLAMSAVALLAAYSFWCAGRSIREDLSAVPERAPAAADHAQEGRNAAKPAVLS